MKLRGVNRLPLLVLAIAIAIAPGLHSVFGCADDEAPSRRAPESTQQVSQVQTSGHKDHHRGNLPDGACCELALALGAFACSEGSAKVPGWTDRTFFALAMTIVLPIGDLSGSVAVCAPSHPPPVAPIFLKIHSFLLRSISPSFRWTIAAEWRPFTREAPKSAWSGADGGRVSTH